jgi:Na+-transporting NADH:ubiquinone oxidoreductase subunit C
MKSLRWLALPIRPDLATTGALAGAALLSAVIPASVSAATYATAEDVAKRAFPAATAFKEVLVTPAPEDAAALSAPGAMPRVGPVRTIEARQGDAVLGRVVVDAVIGKFELIDYAVALDANARVLAIEILTYREGHGAEVRLPAWRNQFVGKTAADPLRIGADIANISGATLSCTHITDGVHRVVAWAAKLTTATAPAKLKAATTSATLAGTARS